LFSVDENQKIAVPTVNAESETALVSQPNLQHLAPAHVDEFSRNLEFHSVALDFSRRLNFPIVETHSLTLT